MNGATTNAPDGATTDAGDGQQANDGGSNTGGEREFTAPKDQDEFDRMVADRLRRERAKFADYDALKDKAAKFDELDAASKTETEKLTERATTAEARATKAESDALRWEIALDKGLTKTQAKRLVGTTREELEADADELLKDLGTKQKNVVPKEGSTPKSAPDDERTAVRQLFGSGG